MENKIYGIDLGTTYSAIAYVNEYNQAETIRNSENEQTTPSAIFFESSDNIIVGKVAKEAAKTDADSVVEFVKRQIGTDWTFNFDGTEYKPEELSSYILRRLAEDARKTGEHEVKEVVITCPAYFGDAERNATRLAGELAGLNVVQILDEPAAAALYYGFDQSEGRRNAIVYDLGGGTFDVSVVSIDGSEIRIVCTDGDHRLGGKDWDDAIINDFVSDFQNETGVEGILDDPETCYDLRLSAENAKKTLTNRETAPVRVSFGGSRVNIQYSRERFESSTSHLLDRTIEFTRSVLAVARAKGVEKIDDFLLVGGSTRMKMVERRIREEFESELGVVPRALDVDEAVAKGAALFGQCRNVKITLEKKAQELAGKSFDELSDSERESVVDETSAEQGVSSDYLLETSKISITTVATKSYGIRVKKNGRPILHHLIVRQSSTPVVSALTCYTDEADAEAIDIRVFSSNLDAVDAELDEGEEVGVTTLELPPGLPEHTRVEVTFTLSEEGVLELTAVASGREAKATFKAEVGMSDEEIRAAKERSRDVVIE